MGIRTGSITSVKPLQESGTSLSGTEIFKQACKRLRPAKEFIREKKEGTYTQ